MRGRHPQKALVVQYQALDSKETWQTLERCLVHTLVTRARHEAASPLDAQKHLSALAIALPPRLDTQLLLRFSVRFSDGTEIIIFVKKHNIMQSNNFTRT